MKHKFLACFICLCVLNISSIIAYEVMQRPSMIVMGIDSRTSNHPEGAPKDIPVLWDRFLNEDIISKIPNKASNEVICLYCDYEGDFTQPYKVVIGTPVTSMEEIPEGMVAKTVPGGSYAVFSAKGEFPQSIIDTWEKVWQTPLDRTYTGDYEVYGDKFYGPQKEVDICVAIISETDKK